MIEAQNYVNKSIGNYRIIELIGSGGFGSVYRGEHLILKDRLVAIKILHNYLSSQEEFNRFLQEAQLLEHMQHPHILQIFDAGVEGNLPYFVTEYAPHGSLRDLLKRYGHTPLPMEMALNILSQVGGALYYAHQHHIVHRDLKPENILFNASDVALLADFGIASTLTTSSVKYSSVIGTPSYMAPEQFQGTISQEGDQYALGCIAYELFTGQAPFTAPDFFAMGFKHLTDRPIDPTQLNPTLPGHIEQAILKAMAKQRGDRHPDVRAFIVALHGSGSQASWSDASTTVANTNGTAPTYRVADNRAFPAATYLSDASTYIRTNPISHDQPTFQQQQLQPPQQLQSTERAFQSDEERRWQNRSQVTPIPPTIAWNGEVLHPGPNGRAPRRPSITMLIASVVVVTILVTSLAFLVFPKLASQPTGSSFTPTTIAQSTSTGAVQSPTARATSTHAVNRPTSTSTSTIGQTSATPTTNTTTPHPTKTPVTPTVTVTPGVSPTGTVTPPLVGEQLSLPFDSVNGVTTQNSYSGTVNITVRGSGQASATAWSDAFFVYTDNNGNPLNPPINRSCWVLYINSNPGVNFLGGIPPQYQSSHQYTFSINLSQPGNINFNICDNQKSDNTGALTIWVHQQ